RSPTSNRRRGRMGYGSCKHSVAPTPASSCSPCWLMTYCGSSPGSARRSGTSYRHGCLAVRAMLLFIRRGAVRTRIDAMADQLTKASKRAIEHYVRDLFAKSPMVADAIAELPLTDITAFVGLDRKTLQRYLTDALCAREWYRLQKPDWSPE